MVLTQEEEIELELIRRDLAEKNWDDREFRLTSWVFYKILWKDGKIVPYKPNTYQILLQETQHTRNIILKARQIWFSTEIDIEALDFWIKHPWVRVGIIAQDKKAAEDIFRDKLMTAWEGLPKNIKDKFTVDTKNVRELWLKHKESWLTSYITVSTSFRWWTLQFLHISEFGKICAKFPEKAREIVTGALPALGPDGKLFIESTAEGNEWYYYQMFQDARAKMEQWKELTSVDLKPYFFAWWENKTYSLDEDEKVIITREHLQYFKSVEEITKVKLSIWQKKRWVKQHSILQDDMGREYPSYIDEAFNLAVEWAYYKNQMELARKQWRIGKVLYNPNLPVYCVRDLWWFWGWDEMAMIFYQKDWEFINIIDSEEHSWYSMEQFQTEFVLTKWYRIVEDRFPHDWKRTESNGKSVSQNARDLWIPVRQLPIWRISDWINELKRIFHKIRIDEENAASLIKSLSNYRREWDKKRGMYMDKPFHNRASHWCFVWDTKVYTRYWDKNIVDIELWDFVLTSVWYRKVIDRIYKWEQEVFDLQWLVWTWWHEIITWKWKTHLAKITKTDTISYLTDNYIYIWEQLYTMVENINCMNEKSIIDVSVDLKRYIRQNGRTLIEKLRNENKYITLILIRLIMIYLIYNVLQQKNIGRCTQNATERTKILWKGLESLQIMPEHLHQNDIEVKNELSGTKNIMRSLKTNFILKLKGIVNIVEGHTIHILGKVTHFVATTVNLRFVRLLELIILKVFAPVHVTALPKTTGRIEDVFNITVEWQHEYYANWILVGNSDAARYLAVSFKDDHKKEMTNIQKKTAMMWNDKKMKRFNALTWFN